MKKVIARPGDMVTHRNIEGTHRVVSVKEYEDGRGLVAPSGKTLVLKNNTGGEYRDWRVGYAVQLHGEIVTDYVDVTAPETKSPDPAGLVRPGDTVYWEADGSKWIVAPKEDYSGTLHLGEFVLLSKGGSTPTPARMADNFIDKALTVPVTGYAPSTTADAIANRIFQAYDHDEPAAVTVNEDRDADGMVTGWNGRKVWL